MSRGALVQPDSSACRSHAGEIFCTEVSTNHHDTHRKGLIWHLSPRRDGLRAAALFEWPGAVHEGNGEAQIFIDESADETQREALLKILTG